MEELINLLKKSNENWREIVEVQGPIEQIAKHIKVGARGAPIGGIDRFFGFPYRDAPRFCVVTR